MSGRPPIDTYPDDDGEDDGLGGLPDGFFPDDASDSDIEYALKVRDVVGQSLSELTTTVDELIGEGRGNQLRAVRFGSGVEALRWLFRRALFLYSRVVQFQDGTWGVAIGETPTIDSGEMEDDSIVF